MDRSKPPGGFEEHPSWKDLSLCIKSRRNPNPETVQGPSSEIFAGNFDLVLPKIQERYRALRQGSSCLTLGVLRAKLRLKASGPYGWAYLYTGTASQPGCFRSGFTKRLARPEIAAVSITFRPSARGTQPYSSSLLPMVFWYSFL